jgi:hypothetical protein
MVNITSVAQDIAMIIPSCVCVTKDGVRIGNWIYWILTGRNYK